ncbi:SIR2 family protein [Wenyingzhuangia sp. IMCC45533]
MMTYEDLRRELVTKERSIADLIRYIGTRTDDNPNYSLFIGSGCSITSGIKSGNKLIEKWRKDLCPTNEKNIDEYFKKQVWYDERNPYSALFERKYDLPRQRRMFVEEEVRDKTPSIGYSYLTKLVEESYFKTLFTTNFDDLLNESFYQYSNIRPIVCAHDSSINSITVTSKRPKVIKLHGDYLFDDIKSTLRETESLEENIKNKFIEFSKDYGLVVVGYGGNDRSIMDILNYLLKNEEYFKYGIYWCLREDTEISEDLRKLLWKDRVYYVKIDGFDELMSELNVELNNGELPIDGSFLNEKKNKLIDNLITNKYLKTTKNDFIKKDFQRLKKAKNIDIVNSFFDFLSEKETSKEDDENDYIKSKFKFKNSKIKALNREEETVLKKINRSYLIKDYEKTLKDVDVELSINPYSRTELRVELLFFKVRVLIKLNRDLEAKIYIKELIGFKENEISLYLKLFELEKEKDLKLEWLNKGIKNNPNEYTLYNRKVKFLFNQYLESHEQEKTLLDELLKLTEISLEKYPLVENSIYQTKIDILSEFKEEEELVNIREGIYQFIKKQDDLHPRGVKIGYKLMHDKNVDKQEIIDYLEKSIINSKDDNYKKYNEFNYLHYLAEINDIDNLFKRLNFIEENYILDNDYYELKAEYLLEKRGDVVEAIKCLEKIENRDQLQEKTLFKNYLLNDDLDKAKLIMNKSLWDNYLKADYYIASENYDEALKTIEQDIVEKGDNKDNAIAKSFILLKKKDYPAAYNFTSKKLTLSAFTDGYLLVNYFLAEKKLNKFKEQKVIDKFKRVKCDNILKAAKYALLNKKDDMYSFIQKSIRSDKSFKYRIKSWVVFKEYLEEPRMKRILDV